MNIHLPDKQVSAQVKRICLFKGFTQVFTAAAFIIAKIFFTNIQVFTCEQINKLCYIHTMECQSAIKMNKLQKYARTWMNLRTITAKQRSQTQKTKLNVVWLSFTCIFKKGQNLVTEASRWLVVRDMGRDGAWEGAWWIILGWTFVISAFTLRSVVHRELNFVYGVRKGSMWVLFFVFSICVSSFSSTIC